jgi:hypothetical protein
LFAEKGSAASVLENGKPATKIAGFAHVGPYRLQSWTNRNHLKMGIAALHPIRAKPTPTQACEKHRCAEDLNSNHRDQ